MNIVQMPLKMDFDIGNILYIVITLVAVTVGLLGKKKKPGNGGGESAAKPGFFENLQRVLQMDQEQDVFRNLQDYQEDLPVEDFDNDILSPSEPPVAQPLGGSSGILSNRPNILEEYDRIMRSNQEGEGYMQLDEGGLMADALQVIEIDEIGEGSDYFEIIRDFDAGKAIVYSAIINRLDY